MWADFTEGWSTTISRPADLSLETQIALASDQTLRAFRPPAFRPRELIVARFTINLISVPTDVLCRHLQFRDASSSLPLGDPLRRVG